MCTVNLVLGSSCALVFFGVQNVQHAITVDLIDIDSPVVLQDCGLQMILRPIDKVCPRES